MLTLVIAYTALVAIATLCVRAALIEWGREVRIGFAWYRFSIARRAAHKDRGGAG